MPYEKTNWLDRVVERPRTFTVTNNADGSITLAPSPGTVVQEGTPVNALNMNKIEGAIEELFTSVSSGKALLETAVTDMGGQVSKSNDVATFTELETGIRSIPVGDYKIGEVVTLANSEPYYSFNDEAQITTLDDIWTQTQSYDREIPVYEPGVLLVETGQGGYVRRRSLIDGAQVWQAYCGGTWARSGRPSPSRKKVMIGTSGSARVREINTDTGASKDFPGITANFDLFNGGSEFLPDGAVVLLSYGQLYVFNTDDTQRWYTYVGSSVNYLHVGKDGYIYVWRQSSTPYTVWRINPSNGATVWSLEVSSPRSVQVDENGKLYIADASNNYYYRKTVNGTNNATTDWSRGSFGDQIAWARLSPTGKIYLSRSYVAAGTTVGYKLNAETGAGIGSTLGAISGDLATWPTGTTALGKLLEVIVDDPNQPLVVTPSISSGAKISLASQATLTGYKILG